MASTKTLLYYGALLHDIGRVVLRAAPTDDKHAELGSRFVLDDIAQNNEYFMGVDGALIAEQIRHQSKEDLAATTNLPHDSLAFISWFAHDVATGFKDVGAEDPVSRRADLRKIFNTLNGHSDDGTIPHDEYSSIVKTLRQQLANIVIDHNGVNTLLQILESTIATVPASTDSAGLDDVSLYDLAKATAAIASCIHDFLHEHGMSNYREALFDSGAADDDMFLMYSCDMSGIQDFIYNISGDGALKQLRARSMYLELLLEHIVDELLQRLELSRANVLYTGGGHAYLLLPNTKTTASVLDAFVNELRGWLVDHYRNDLYVANAWVACSANDLANNGPDFDRYPTIYRTLSRQLSESKAARYNAEIIRALNFGPQRHFDHTRECSECHRSDLIINGDGKCSLCAALGEISKDLIDKDVFVVERANSTNGSDRGYATLPLPFGCRLRMCSRNQLRSTRKQPHRIYVKNCWSPADKSATLIRMSDYTASNQEDRFAVYASCGETLERNRGIKRLGVIRADVDDLGATFAGGLPNQRTNVCRTSTLSRSLSIFFKSTIDEIMERGRYQAQIIYSGGDDLFVVGNWSDVIYAAIDIRNAFVAYTGNEAVTLSAGVGIFGETYPIARMAAQTGELEDAAKGHTTGTGTSSKNAIALWSPEYVFGWAEFCNDVLPRMQKIRDMFEGVQKGNAFIYKIIVLLRSYNSIASAPRLAYLLARSFEEDTEHGSESCRQLYAWAQDVQERRRLLVSLEWYVLSKREGNKQ